MLSHRDLLVIDTIQLWETTPDPTMEGSLCPAAWIRPF